MAIDQHKTRRQDSAPQHRHGSTGADDPRRGGPDLKATRDARRTDALGRPDPDEDKDMNVEQLKSKRPGTQPRRPSAIKEAERIDPGGRTRAGERRP